MSFDPPPPNLQEYAFSLETHHKLGQKLLLDYYMRRLVMKPILLVKKIPLLGIWHAVS